MKIVTQFTLTVVALTAAGLRADEPPRGDGRGTEPFSDRMFIEKAAIGGMFEVKSSQLAQRMAGNSAVTDFATRMVVDHTKANKELTALAARKGWQLPTDLDARHKELLESPRRGEGGGSDGSVADRFDRAYLEMQVLAHNKTVPLFEKASQQAQDADLRAWATEMLPTLKEHQKLAKQLSSRGAHPATTPPQ
jgi:putative membrane protein